MMDFLEVAPFRGRLGILPEYPHQNFDLMSITSLTKVMNHIIPLALIRLALHSYDNTIVEINMKNNFSLIETSQHDIRVGNYEFKAPQFCFFVLA